MNLDRQVAIERDVMENTGQGIKSDSGTGAQMHEELQMSTTKKQKRALKTTGLSL